MEVNWKKGDEVKGRGAARARDGVFFFAFSLIRQKPLTKIFTAGLSSDVANCPWSADLPVRIRTCASEARW
jgi:hypothetical protein